MRYLRVAVIAAVCLLSAGMLIAQSSEKKISRADLPDAVQKTVAMESKGAVVRGFSKEVEKGQTYFEMELMDNGHKKDVLIAADGKIVEVEEEIALESVPPEVRKSLESKAGVGEIIKVESLTRQGKLVAYEAQVVTGKKHSEIQVGPAGEKLTREE